VEGIFPGVHHKTSSIYERFRKPLLCVKITRGFITSVTKSPLKLIFFVVNALDCELSDFVFQIGS